MIKKDGYISDTFYHMSGQRCQFIKSVGGGGESTGGPLSTGPPDVPVKIS